MFRDRDEAGRRLAQALARRGLEGASVLGIPRGGVPVAAAVARALGGPLGVVVARKLGAPGDPELAIGAVAADGTTFVDIALAIAVGAHGDYLRAEIRWQLEEARRRERLFLGRRGPPLAGRAVVVIDDGLATGATAIAAVRSVKAAGARRVVLAAPVASASAAATLREEADEVAFVIEDPRLCSIGDSYEYFGQLDDAEVRAILDAAAPLPPPAPHAAGA